MPADAWVPASLVPRLLNEPARSERSSARSWAGCVRGSRFKARGLSSKHSGRRRARPAADSLPEARDVHVGPSATHRVCGPRFLCIWSDVLSAHSAVADSVERDHPRAVLRESLGPAARAMVHARGRSCRAGGARRVQRPLGVSGRRRIAGPVDGRGRAQRRHSPCGQRRASQCFCGTSRTFITPGLESRLPSPWRDGRAGRPRRGVRESFAGLAYLVRETHADARDSRIARPQRDSMGPLARRRSSRVVGALARDGVDRRGESASSRGGGHGIPAGWGDRGQADRSRRRRTGRRLRRVSHPTRLSTPRRCLASRRRRCLGTNRCPSVPMGVDARSPGATAFTASGRLSCRCRQATLRR